MCIYIWIYEFTSLPVPMRLCRVTRRLCSRPGSRGPPARIPERAISEVLQSTLQGNSSIGCKEAFFHIAAV